MSQSYTEFSVEVKTTEETNAWLTGYLDSEEHHADVTNDDGEHWGLEWDPGDDNYGFNVECEKGKITVWADEVGMVDEATDFICTVLQHENSDEIVLFEFSMHHSKSVPGEFGGGTALVSREGVEWAPEPWKWFEQRSAGIKMERLAHTAGIFQVGDKVHVTAQQGDDFSDFDGEVVYDGDDDLIYSVSDDPRSASRTLCQVHGDRMTIRY